jgi:hypothetical protein
MHGMALSIALTLVPNPSPSPLALPMVGKSQLVKQKVEIIVMGWSKA